MSLLSLFSAKEHSIIVKSDGYYVRVVTLTEGASTQFSENTTTGIQQSLTTPGELSALELTYLVDELLVAWSTAAFDGGYPILGYQLKVDGELACELVEGQQYCSSLAERMFALGRLALGHSYNFEVAAVNQRGVGVFSGISYEMPPIPRIPSETGPTAPNGPIVLEGDTDGSSGSADPDGVSPSEPGDTDAGPTRPNAPEGTEQGIWNWFIWSLPLLLAAALTRLIIKSRREKLKR
jgi:hypothetical protein